MSPTSSTPHRNGVLPSPRKSGAIPYRSPSGRDYSVEHWQIPAMGSRWLVVVMASGAYLCSPSAAADDPDCGCRDGLATVDLAQRFEDPEAAKSAIAAYESGSARVPTGVMKYRSHGVVYKIVECADTDGKPFWSAASEDGEWCASKATAALAQDAAEAHASRHVRPAVTAQIRAIADRVEAGEVDASVAKGRDGEVVITFREVERRSGR